MLSSITHFFSQSNHTHTTSIGSYIPSIPKVSKLAMLFLSMPFSVLAANRNNLESREVSPISSYSTSIDQTTSANNYFSDMTSIMATGIVTVSVVFCSIVLKVKNNQLAKVKEELERKAAVCQGLNLEMAKLRESKITSPQEKEIAPFKEELERNNQVLEGQLVLLKQQLGQKSVQCQQLQENLNLSVKNYKVLEGQLGSLRQQLGQKTAECKELKKQLAQIEDKFNRRNDQIQGLRLELAQAKEYNGHSKLAEMNKELHLEKSKVLKLRNELHQIRQRLGRTLEEFRRIKEELNRAENPPEFLKTDVTADCPACSEPLFSKPISSHYFNEGVNVGRLCTPQYHTECFEQWLTKGSKSCPTCREDVESLTEVESYYIATPASPANSPSPAAKPSGVN